ncbi:MAG: hypothetical protein WBM76_00940 [Woeseiaceae bacterium]
MSAVFWIATIVMAALAFSFVAPPLMRNNRRFGLVGVALALPAFAAGLYLLVGSPQAASINPPAASAAPASRDMNRKSSKAVGSVASMTDGLAARLAENPDDGKSWLLLAKSYHHLKQLPEAREAYEKAVALGEYDEMLATSFDAPVAEETGARIFGNVKLSERSKAIVKPTDTVFIFARAVDGPPMPVAVLQRPVSELPLDFLLNDSQAMSADMKLSNFDRVVVTARVSRSGVATDALQDLEAKSEPIVVAENRHLDLLIE